MKEGSMVYFEIFPWNKNFETGIEKIDEQHKQLVHILNQLAAHLANRSDALQLNDIFDELAAYADYHFKTEEAVWSHHFASDEWATGHEQTHGSFIEQVVAIKNNEGKKPLDDVVYEIVTFLSKWLAYHILDTDKRMAIAVLKMDAGMPLEEAKHAATEEMGGAMKVIVDTVLNMYESLSTRTLDLMREKSLRLQAEAALEQSEERWRFIVESGSDNVWDWDIEHNTLKRSEQNPSLFEIADKHVRSAHKEVKVHPGDIAQINADFQAHLDGKTDFYVNKHRILQQNGSWSWVLSRGKVIERDEAGRPLRMVGTHTDITEREFASLIHKNSTQAIFISDEENHIVSVNPAFSDITGYSEAEAIGQNPRFLASGIHDDAYYAAMWERLGAKGMWKGKITNRRKEGGLYTEWLEIHAVRNPQGEIDHYIAMFNDITKEEAHEKEQAVQREYLLQQSRMAQMGELISMIAHQWRQPLNIIASMSAALQTKLAVNKFDLALESGREAFKSFFDKNLKDIDAHVANLTVTMDDFRNFYNPNKQSSMLSIESPVKKALSIIRASLTSHDIVIEEKYEDTQPVEMHENEIIQVILNVLKNAQDNFKEKKTPSPKIVISTKRTEASTLLQICDNGGGIPADIMERIFEPYFSTKSEHMGTGLGLHMSRMIMESHHNGRFYAGNTADGVCFTIELSLAGDAE